MAENRENYLAENLKSYRIKRNYTQEEFSKLSGLARSTITNIESGEANPSLSKVIRIAEALGVSIDQLISKPRLNIVLLQEKDLSKELRGKGVEILKLFPNSIEGTSIDKVKIKPGEVLRGQAHLSGTKEYLTVLEGTLEITINGQKYIVNKNDLLAFPGDVSHGYKNIGKSTLVYMSFVFPFPDFT